MQQLSKDAWLACARGFVQAREEADGLHFLRFGDRALKYYAQREGWLVRAYCPAGVCFDFTTDSPSVRVRAALRPGARKMAWFDLYADGLLTGTLGASEPGETIAGAMPCGPREERRARRIQLWLPHTRPAALLEVALEDGASFAPSPAAPAQLFLGDSITQGMDAHHPSFGYAMTASRVLGLGHFNYGIGGAIFAAESLPEAPLAQPREIVVAYGTNDWSGAQPLENARAYLRRVRELWSQTPVAVLEPLWRTSCDGPEAERNSAGQSLNDYRAAIAGFAREVDMRVCSFEQLLPPVPEMLVDGTHPGDMGHLAYGANVAALLRKD